MANAITFTVLISMYASLTLASVNHRQLRPVVTGALLTYALAAGIFVGIADGLFRHLNMLP